MNVIRYIITRSCLQEGIMRLLKYNEGYFAQGGPAQFVDDSGREYTVQVDRERMRVSGMRNFYHDHNLGVNDVLLLTPIAAGRYQVETIVKPHPVPSAAANAPRSLPPRAPEVQRVVVASTPHVREVRMQRSAPLVSAPVAGSSQPSSSLSSAPTPEAPRERESATETAPRPELRRETTQEIAALFSQHGKQAARDERPEVVPRPAPVAAAGLPHSIEDQVAEFARLTGYHLEFPASGLMRLHAELGKEHSYSVLLAADPLATTQPAWNAEGYENRLLLTHEAERPEGHSRLTREALSALIEHARLAPLSPLDLRGYWRAGNFDLDSAASISELVSAHLAQRGAFSFVLLSLAGQPANSIVSASQLASQLGSGVNFAELNTILDTLARPPFLALTPLQGGQYLLRASVGDMLADLAEYAQGVRRRVRTPGQAVPTGEAIHA